MGQNLVCPRFKSDGNLFERRRPVARNGKTRLQYRRLCLHHLQRHEWRAGSKIQKEIIDRDLYATAVLSGNRNYDGRVHPYAKQTLLATPPLVVAYALTASIRFDIENDVLGVADGKEIRLKDIWPADEEIDAVVAEYVKPQQFRDVYVPMFDTGTAQKAPSQLYEWRPMPTYIRRTHCWEGALNRENAHLRGMRPMTILNDNIRNDHLSPSNAILESRAEGEKLAKAGLTEKDLTLRQHHRGHPHYRSTRFLSQYETV